MCGVMPVSMKETQQPAAENHTNTLPATLDISYWKDPGVRHQGLDVRSLTMLMERLGALVEVTANHNCLVCYQCGGQEYQLTFNEAGRLVRSEMSDVAGDDYPIIETVGYDKLGRVVSYSYSGDGESNPANSVVERFVYPEGEPDDHYVRTRESAAFGSGNRAEEQTWAMRQVANRQSTNTPR